MSMYFIGIDISKYKHDCCIISAANQKVVSKVIIKNNKAGFNELLTIIHSLANPADIRIGFESTSHYALNLELFLENSLLTFMEVNPVLISEYKKSKTLRRTKTDSVDCESIARWLMTVEYKPHSKGFCLPLIRFDMTFATYYAKKRGEGKPHRVAITHVAKKLIRVIYALESQDIDFNAQELR